MVIATPAGARVSCILGNNDPCIETILGGKPEKSLLKAIFLGGYEPFYLYIQNGCGASGPSWKWSLEKRKLFVAQALEEGGGPGEVAVYDTFSGKIHLATGKTPEEMEADALRLAAMKFD